MGNQLEEKGNVGGNGQGSNVEGAGRDGVAEEAGGDPFVISGNHKREIEDSNQLLLLTR